MAFVPFFVLGPSSLISLIGFFYGPDETIPTPKDDWRNATMDLLIPVYNEESNIILCLTSIIKQTIQPRQIIIIDDASTDQTIERIKAYEKFKNLNFKIIRRIHSEGKTPSLAYMAKESDADVIAVVDGDTILKSNNYLERLLQELYQGVGISSACGFVFPFTEEDRRNTFVAGNLQEFANLHPEIDFSPDKTWFEKFLRSIANAYREELYLFLQHLVYRGEMTFFGTLIFPIGCAAVYRREYLKNLFDHYLPIYGYDLTTSEDIFFGFAFDRFGYRNVAVHDVFACTQEPRINQMFHQIFKWSSAFLQSTYYFNSLFLTPFKIPRILIKKYRDRNNKELEKQIEKRRVKEAYRQAWGSEYTKKYGRNIGWFIFTTAFEKITFPAFILIVIILGFWETLLITVVAEVTLYTFTIFITHKNRRIRNSLKAILFTPIRYMQIMFDLFVAGNFMVDLWLTKNRKWRK